MQNAFHLSPLPGPHLPNKIHPPKKSFEQIISPYWSLSTVEYFFVVVTAIPESKEA